MTVNTIRYNGHANFVNSKGLHLSFYIFSHRDANTVTIRNKHTHSPTHTHITCTPSLSLTRRGCMANLAICITLHKALITGP